MTEKWWYGMRLVKPGCRFNDVKLSEPFDTEEDALRSYNLKYGASSLCLSPPFQAPDKESAEKIAKQKTPPGKGYMETLRPIVTHEVGHWITARKLGFTTGGIQFDKEHPEDSGSTKIFPMPKFETLDDVESYCMKRLAVLCAGMISEVLFRNPNSPEITDSDLIQEAQKLVDESGVDDTGKIKELIFIVRGIKFQNEEISLETECSQCQEITNLCFENARQIIRENAGASRFIIKRLCEEICDSKRRDSSKSDLIHEDKISFSESLLAKLEEAHIKQPEIYK